MNIIEPESMYVIENMNKELEEVQNENIKLQKQIKEKDRKIQLVELLREKQLKICFWDRELKQRINSPISEWSRANFWVMNGREIALMFGHNLSEDFSVYLTGFCLSRVSDDEDDYPIEEAEKYDEMIHLESLLKDEMLIIFPKEEFNFIDDSSDDE